MIVNWFLREQTIQLIRMLDSFTQASTISNVISALRGAGIKSYYDDEEGCLFHVVIKSN